MKLPTVYTGAFGYRDNDALAHFAAPTPEAFDAAITKAIEEEETDSSNTCYHERETRQCDDTCEECDGAECVACHPDIWYVGPFPESILTVVRSIRFGAGQRRFFLDDLRVGAVAMESYE